MLNTQLTRLTIAGALALSTAAAQAQNNDPLIDALVRKGVLNSQEADEIRADLVKEASTSSANKLKLSSSIMEMKLSGDTRLRYQYDNRDSQLPSLANDSQRSRYRFRLRLNADFNFNGPFFGGVGLETGQAADSANQTFQDGFDDYEIFISRAYLGWEPTDWLTVVAGKQKNPFYSTNLVWDSDINPVGLTQTVNVHKLFGWGTTTDEGHAGKDGKSAAPTTSRKWSDPGWELALNAGQLIFDDNNEFNGLDNDEGADAYLFVAQAVAAVKLGSVRLTFAPGWMFYNAADTSGLRNENAFSGVAGVSGETRHLNILLAPGDIAFKLGGVPTTLYWDFAYNIEGSERGENVYGIPASALSEEDNFAWLFGVQFGKNKSAGDWSFFVNYRETGINAVDPNLNDSDFALGELNTRGFETALAYNLTDFLTLGLEYNYAWNKRVNLFEGQATSGASIADTNVTQVVQFDLSWKF